MRFQRSDFGDGRVRQEHGTQRLSDACMYLLESLPLLNSINNNRSIYRNVKHTRKRALRTWCPELGIGGVTRRTRR